MLDEEYGSWSIVVWVNNCKLQTNCPGEPRNIESYLKNAYEMVSDPRGLGDTTRQHACPITDRAIAHPIHISKTNLDPFHPRIRVPEENLV